MSRRIAMPSDTARPALWGGTPLFPTPIRVTEPTLPPLASLLGDLEAIWTARRLGNDGPYAQALAARLGEQLGAHVVPVASGTAALTTALAALGVRGEVVVPALTFVATAQAVLAAGATPVLADVDPRTGCLTAESARAAMTNRAEALLPVHLFGARCDVPGLERLARAAGLALVFDAAHALAAAAPDRDRRRPAVAGDAEAYSLHATKALPAGEGGFVATGSAALAERCRRYARFGLDGDGLAAASGVNAKLAEIPALLALRGLPDLPARLAHRRRCALRYRRGLAGVPGIAWLPADAGEAAGHPFAAARIDPCRFGLDADALQEALAAEGIEARRYFAPLHRHPAFASAARAPLPVAEALAGELLCLPLSSHLPFADVDRVVEALRRIQAWCAGGIGVRREHPVAVARGG